MSKDREEELDFLDEANDEQEMEATQDEEDLADPVEGSELEAFEAADVEQKEFIDEDQVLSILESLLFSTDRPQSLATLKQPFKGTTVKSSQIKRALEQLAVEYAGARRGVSLEEVASGYQLRTKVDNLDFLKRAVKAKTFKLSGPALEVLSIVAYKQPCIKADVDEIRGVESGHLLRGLMDRSLVVFAGKSELPGKPMLYETTKKFLEIFGLRNIRELPSLSQIDELIPEGIGEEEEKETLDTITDQMSKEAGSTYSEGEEELMSISSELDEITTSSEFFEEEKRRQKEKRDLEKAQDIRERLLVGEEVSQRDVRWLERYDEPRQEGGGDQPQVTDSPEVVEPLEVADSQS